MCSHLDRRVSHPRMHFSVSAWMWLATERTRAVKAWLCFSHLLSLAQHGARERVCTGYQSVISNVAGIKQGEPMRCELRDGHTVRAGRDTLWSQSGKQEGLAAQADLCLCAQHICAGTWGGSRQWLLWFSSSTCPCASLLTRQLSAWAQQWVWR